MVDYISCRFKNNDKEPLWDDNHERAHSTRTLATSACNLLTPLLLSSRVLSSRGTSVDRSRDSCKHERSSSLHIHQL